MKINNSPLAGFVILFLCFLTAAATAAKAQQDSSMAKIIAVQGTVQLTRSAADGNSSTFEHLSVGGDLFFGDVVKTKTGGRLTLALRDGSQAIIGENTVVEIKDTGSSPRTIFNVLRGKTRIKIEKMGGRPNPYRVTTPTTVIAVRGTIFDVFVKGDKTEVFVSEGEVSVTNFLAPFGEVFLLPGQFTRVEIGKPPKNPSSFDPQRNDDFFNHSEDISDGKHGNSDDGDKNGDRNGSDRNTGGDRNGDGQRNDSRDDARDNKTKGAGSKKPPQS